MPGIQRDKSDGLIRPTTRTRIGDWGEKLNDITSEQVWDWLHDVGLRPVPHNPGMSFGGYDFDATERNQYLRTALGALDTTDPEQVRRYMQVLEEALLATRIGSAKAGLQKALELDGFTIDDEGNIVDPASAPLFAIDLSGLEDPSAITQQLGRIHQHLYTNPEEAIDAAAALLAAVLKQVIAHSGGIPGNKDMPKLASQAKPFLREHYTSIGLEPHDAEHLVRGMISIVNGAAPIRNASSPTHPDLSERRSQIAAAELVVSATTPVVRICMEVLKRPGR